MASKNIEKFVEEIGAMSVLDLSELVKAIEEKFGVSAAAPVAVAVGGAAAPAAAAESSEKAEYDVNLKDAGAEKVKVIKALRTIDKDLSVTDAKKIVDEAPALVKAAVPKDEAKKMKEALEAAGAKVELV